MSKEKIEIEYLLNKISVNILWNAISTPSGLSGWFADNVNINDKTYIFTWDKHEQKAKLIAYRNNLYIRFRWEEENSSKYYFEFRISADELTRDITLTITDFADEEEKNDNIDLWNKQIDNLRRAIGI